MLTIEYTAKAKALSDFGIEDTAELVVRQYQITGTSTFKTCNELMIIWLRIMVKRGVISHNDIKFIIDGEVSHIDKNGTLHHHPSVSKWDDALFEITDFLLNERE